MGVRRSHAPSFFISCHVTCSVTKHKHQICQPQRRLMIILIEIRNKQQRKGGVSRRNSDSKNTGQDSNKNSSIKMPHSGMNL